MAEVIVRTIRVHDVNNIHFIDYSLQDIVYSYYFNNNKQCLLRLISEQNNIRIRFR